jgi:predicted RNA-binding Zn-ribbon protein involved in translation (DUF1610 family)
MARRPYIETSIIKREFAPGSSSSSRPDGYVSGAKNKKVIGMDGRNDWFRAECRECGRKHITIRKEKSRRYYSCQECGAWHHQHKGFFNTDRFETVPLRDEEVDGRLYRVELDYAPSEFDQSEWHYGLQEDLKKKADEDIYEAVSDIKPV